MTVKSDRWIRRMALEHGMIEPFEPRQIKELDGRRLISYGTSSYGYDIRCADEFKLFTNINSTIVDPKSFDSKNFVDVKGDHVIVPPNSFALARTVEYFRIPRNVLTICLGKSTYARCFRGDTRVALVDGTAPTLEDMARRAEDGEMFWGYSIGTRGRVLVTLLEEPRYIGRDALVEVILDNGESIHCTPDHQFMLRDGSMIEAHELRPDTSLMPLYRQITREYEMVYQPLNGHLIPTHRMADEWNIRHGIYDGAPHTHRHHIDHERRNNRPWNIVRMGDREQIKHHDKENYGEDFDPVEHGAALSEALQRLSQDPAWRQRFSQEQRHRALNFWHEGAYVDARSALIEARRKPADETRQAHRDAMLRRYSDPAARARHSESMKAAWAKDDGNRRRAQAELMREVRLRGEITADVVRAALDQTGSICGAAKFLECDRSVFRRFPDVVRSFKGLRQARNHKVVAVREHAGDHDVYCLTVPEAGNFALEAGVFTHNCGIIVNVTPFEPEWEGYVTLEFSNTTPLPAKIYANEGVAQVIFFESDEVCETSYKDRGGKYQKQHGVTLPRL